MLRLAPRHLRKPVRAQAALGLPRHIAQPLPRHIAQPSALPSALPAPRRSPGLWKPQRGFQRRDYGLQWHSTKESLLADGPGPVLVGTSYEYDAQGASGESAVRQAKKYASVQTHTELWDIICRHEWLDRPHNLHEVFLDSQPRNLYFDLDGEPGYRAIHPEIINWLRVFVRWFFSGDRLGWADSDPEPLVLMTENPAKYSCHVVFPQIHFANYAQQCEYMQIMLNALPALVAELEGGESVPILEKVVDRVPYTKFQLFRGPYACKLTSGVLRRETRLEPEGHFRDDPLAAFASRVNEDYALELPPTARLLEWNEELRFFNERQQSLVSAANGGTMGQVSPQDMANLYTPTFQTGRSGGILDFAGLSDLEQYEVAMQHLNPDRALQWWSWFRMSGVTYTMLDRYKDNADARKRIWKAHFAWSSKYPGFCEDENVNSVMKCQGSRVSGLQLLFQLVRFDNPGMEVRTSTWQVHFNTAG